MYLDAGMGGSAHSLGSPSDTVCISGSRKRSVHGIAVRYRYGRSSEKGRGQARLIAKRKS
jgi:hypothetical protein